MKNKKFLFIFIVIFIFNASIGYALLNRTLSISGTTEVYKNTWDIHFDNVRVKEGSVEASQVPTLSTNKDAVNFSVALKVPGDFYEFTIEAVNTGSMDGMIDALNKIPELSVSQKKYLNYIIEYENGEQISSKQLVKVDSSVKIKVRVEYKIDINKEDLPTENESLNLGFSIDYVQADETGVEVLNDGANLISIISGDGTQEGDEVSFGKERFYVMYSDDDTVTMLAKYNLHVGYTYFKEAQTESFNLIENPTGIQNSKAIGNFAGSSRDNPAVGITKFADTAYYDGNLSNYPNNYIYSSDSYIYSYIENYKNYLIDLGITVNNARVISKEEVEDLGCSLAAGNCSGAPEWVYSTTYWTGTYYDYAVLVVLNNLDFMGFGIRTMDIAGVRPVIEVPKSYLR